MAERWSDPEEIAREVLALADEHPDAYYRAGEDEVCSYSRGTAGDGVGCIFGQALRRLGMPEEELASLDELNYGTSVSIAYVLDKIAPTTPSHLLATMSVVQKRQDLKDSWGDAVWAVRNYVKGNL